jgi:hypothetical protein
MADAKERPVDIEDSSQLAPKYPAKFKSALTADEDIWMDADDLPLGGVPRDRSPKVQNLLFRSSLDPTILPGPPPSSRRRRPIGLMAFLGFASVAAGVMVMRNEERAGVGDEAGKTSLLSRLSALVAGDPRPANMPAPHLAVTTAPGALRVDKASTLGLAVYGAADGGQLVVGGYIAGSVFSVGQSIGQNVWSLPVSQIENATLIPPRGFVGVMDIAITLMLANGSLTDRKTVHLEWLPEPTVLQSSVSRQIDPGEISVLIARGSALMATGYLAGARLMYQRAAEAGNAGAAFTLAETYDPIVLETWGEWLAPDVAMARTWYRRAKDLGSRDALNRLERLEHRSD